MRTRTCFYFCVLLLLGAASLASAQERTFRGNVVDFQDGTMIFRVEEAGGRIYTVDLSGLPADVRASLMQHRQQAGLGQAIHLVARPGTGADDLVASRVTVDQPDRRWGEGQNRRFLKVSGTVESTSGQKLTIKTPSGQLIPMEGAQRLTVSPGQAVTLVYEEAPNGRRLLRWIDASVTASAASQPSQPLPPGAGGEFKGTVLFTSGDTVAIGTDAGRVQMVDVSGLDRQARRSLELGRAVTVTGRAGTTATQPFVAAAARVDRPDVAWGQAPHRRLLQVEGTVESVNGPVVNLRTASGLVPVDVSRTGWKPAANEHATVVYEEESSRGQWRRLARWVERDGASSALPRSLPGW